MENRTALFGAAAVALLWLARRARRQDVDASVTGTLRIGTRKSDLAMVQTRHVRKLLRQAFPNLKVEIQEGVNALGDRELDDSLKNLAAKVRFRSLLLLGLG